ncbi:phosphatase PAP2 family protein [Bauldia sp.]|uniref:phosphatase PAP2 family protein n=1 Tax=Bauldia sp. TaxID=2575872 RepID=UPI003BA95AC8
MDAVRKGLAALILVAATVVAAPATSDDAPVFLPAGSVDAEALIGPPPAIGSAAFAEQMTVVLWLQRTRTPDQVAFVEQTLDVERFAPILGAALFQVDAAALKTTIDLAIDQVRDDYDAVKDVYDLPRPFQVDDAVDPVGDARPVASYPSGHAIRAIVYARLLAEVFPDHRDALMDLAERVGYGRVVAGVHYPIDITAGQTLGHAYADVIVAQPAFRDAVVAASASGE